MNLEEKQKYHHGDLRSALITATIEIINQQGIEGLTMRGLSTWVGVSRTAAYRHFNDKADLLAAAAMEGFKQFSEALKVTRIDLSLNELERFKNMGQAYIKFAVDNPVYYRLMFGDVVIQKSKALNAISDTAFSEIVLMLEMLQAAKFIEKEEAKLQAIYIWSLMHGVASLTIDNKLDKAGDLQQVTAFMQKKIMKSITN